MQVPIKSFLCNHKAKLKTNRDDKHIPSLKVRGGDGSEHLLTMYHLSQSKARDSLWLIVGV